MTQHLEFEATEIHPTPRLQLRWRRVDIEGPSGPTRIYGRGRQDALLHPDTDRVLRPCGLGCLDRTRADLLASSVSARISMSEVALQSSIGGSLVPRSLLFEE